MKAMVVCGDEAAAEEISASLVKAGFDTVSYDWLLKAMDNIGEIAPKVIVINSDDWPRHWKAMASFARALKSGARIFLVSSSGSLAEGEENKARALGVEGVFKSPGSAAADSLAAAAVTEGIVALTNPESGALVTGRIIGCDGAAIRIMPDAAESAKGIKAGDAIEEMSVSRADGCVWTRGVVALSGETIEIRIEEEP